MRILFSGTPAYGHLLPLLPLERAARKAGHTTAFLTHASLGDLVAPAPVLPAGASLEETLDEFHRTTGTNAAEDMSPATAGEFFGGIRVDLGADAALAAAHDFGPDLVVAETADFLGPLAAAHLGVPWASHGVGIALEAPLAEAMWATAAARATARGLALARPFASVDPWPDCLQRDDWKPSRDRITVRPEAHESESGSGSGAGWEAPAFPGREHLPRVLVTLGTIVDDPEALTEIVTSLAGREVNVVVALPPSSADGALPVAGAGVHVTGFVPMRLLLQGMDAVVCSGGAGTVLSVLGAGLPLVIWPLGLDKPLNAERTAALGAAEVVGGAGEAGEAVVRVLEEPSYRAAARKAAADIGAMPRAEDVLPLLTARLG
ncbi:UDP:flavonoid glycosyltransferase YjiC (YdhE family) [Streptomyces sp. V3I8]|uniref:glycosyltransferase n=1 Tax=Streptomyces sp. V3I8 TaxID=3042279 RepID=UPI002786550F|nr:glycosyltransferase [Streptomyces sp. V3I8]MDQ1034695.1 UDP:flavonoid glycosyltransferase YjiC (YdhE family) [Streptomyces sp. V3I8]